MSLTSQLQPLVGQFLVSERRLHAQRAARDAMARWSDHETPLRLWYQVNDPYSRLAIQFLLRLRQNLDIPIEVVVLPMPDRSVHAEPVAWFENAIIDAERIAPAWGLHFSVAQRPDQALTDAANRVLVGIHDLDDFMEIERDLTCAYWGGGRDRVFELAAKAVSPEEAEKQLQINVEQQRRAGHYQGGMWEFRGEWFWGVDRWHYLEQRLRDLALLRGAAPLFEFDPRAAQLPATGNTQTLEYWFSLRSPYSYLSLTGVEALMEKYPRLELKIYPVLPMVMRGLPVPLAKKLYIVSDSAREARRLGIPYGRMVDPVGAGVERGLSVWPALEAAGKGLAGLQILSRGCWAEARDLSSNYDLKQLLKTCGLPWEEAKDLLKQGDIAYTESNRKAMFEQGFWGVPSFRLGGLATWGQDRLWMIEEALRRTNLQD